MLQGSWVEILEAMRVPSPVPLPLPGTCFEEGPFLPNKPLLENSFCTVFCLFILSSPLKCPSSQPRQLLFQDLWAKALLRLSPLFDLEMAGLHRDLTLGKLCSGLPSCDPLHEPSDGTEKVGPGGDRTELPVDSWHS